MHNSIRKRALVVVVTGLTIILLAWFLVWLFTPKVYGATSINSLGKGNMPSAIATSTQSSLSVTSSTLEPSLSNWITKLGNCESQNNPDALNPKDTDGTPSYGRFQFKIGTWIYFIKKYNLFGWQRWENADFMNNIWDGKMQETVVRLMIADPTVNLHYQFPACTTKLGLP